MLKKIMLLLAAALMPAAALAQTVPAQPPSIQAAQVNYDSNQITIQGHNFNPVNSNSAPVVSLGGTNLNVLDYNSTAILAQLPEYVSGSYRLMVTANNKTTRFDVALGAGGTQGPPGATGAPGAQGVQGPMGLQGPQGALGIAGLQGSTGPQIWSASFTMPAGLTQFGYLALPSGSSTAAPLPGGIGSTFEPSVLMIPAGGCGVGNFQVTVFNAQNTSNAHFDIAFGNTTDMQNGNLFTSNSACRVTANNGSPVSCSSSLGESLSGFITLYMYFDTPADYQNATVNTSFTCESNTIIYSNKSSSNTLSGTQRTIPGSIQENE